MTINLVLNVILTVVFILFIFITDGRIYEFLLRTPHVAPKNMIWLYFAFVICSFSTLFVGAKISLKRKGHKNLKLEKILTSDFALVASCTGISFIIFIVSIILNASRSF